MSNSSEESNKRLCSEMEFSPLQPANTSPVTMAGIAALLDEKLLPIHNRLSNMEKKVEEAFDSASDSSTRINIVEEEMKEIRNELDFYKKEFKTLSQYITQLDNYQRRDNLNIYGIPEKRGEDCRELVLNMFKEKLGIAPDGIKFTRIHRVGAYSKDYTRPIRAKFHYYQDLELVFGKKSKLVGSGMRITKVYAPQVEANRKRLYPIVSAAYEHKNTLQGDQKSNFNIRFTDDKLQLCGKTYTVENIHDLPAYLKPEVLNTKETDSHVFFWTKHSPFSNHYLSDFTVDDKSYNCSEQYAMYHKAMLFQDVDTADKVMKETNPVIQKRFGNTIANFEQKVWYEKAEDIFKTGIRAKFDQNPQLLDRLKKTGQKKLVEASPHDRYWGVGLRISDKRILSPDRWLGKNKMGELITKIRDELNS